MCVANVHVHIRIRTCSNALIILQNIEDRNLFVGYLAMFMEQYSEAQDLFLSSSYPMAALEVFLTYFVIHVF